MEKAILYITPLVPIVLAVLPILFTKPRYAIKWVVLPPKSMMEIADEISDRLVIKLGEQQVTNLTKFSFILHNSGREPFDADSIVETLKWSGPGSIFDARIIASVPTVNLGIKTRNSDMMISWRLFNQSCQALIEVICESASESDGANITAQIKKVPEIKIKYSNYFDEEEFRKRQRKIMSKSPKLFKILHSETLNVFFFRYRLPLLTLYLAPFVYLLSLQLSNFLVMYLTINVQLIAMSLTLAFLIVLFYLFRNPYSKILRIRSGRGNPSP